jgi:hypothetical protein
MERLPRNRRARQAARHGRWLRPNGRIKLDYFICIQMRVVRNPDTSGDSIAPEYRYAFSASMTCETGLQTFAELN